MKDENCEISVFDYYRKKYNIDLQYWFLPLIETTRDGKFPMELCTLVSNQKYQYKLNPEQTQAMIKFAVTHPPQRLQSIQNGINMLKWQQDPNLLHYGVKIDQNLTLTKAKVLAPPEVEYSAKTKATPGYSGRWDLRGKKFLFANSEPLKSWGVGVIGECLSEADTRNFMNLFIQTILDTAAELKTRTQQSLSAREVKISLIWLSTLARLPEINPGWSHRLCFTSCPVAILSCINASRRTRSVDLVWSLKVSICD
jgi:eukaryotic translation initiation factor 2C